MHTFIDLINLLACLAAGIIFFFGAKNDYAKGAHHGYVITGLSISACFSAGVIINLIKITGA